MKQRDLGGKRSAGLVAGLGVALAGLGGCMSSPKGSESGKEWMAGEQVYAQTCAACHASGVVEAPVYGDKTRWQKLLEEGQVVLSAHGWVGLGAMPPQGGNPDLRLEEFARAVTYMGRGVGADWPDPDAEMLEEIREEIVLRRHELAEKSE